MIIESLASHSNNTAAIWLDYVETEDHEQIHEDQDAFIEAEVKSAKVESDEDQAPVSAKVALKCCQLLRPNSNAHIETRVSFSQILIRCHQLFASTRKLERNNLTHPHEIARHQVRSPQLLARKRVSWIL
uniref:Uncharacterized protein n=1 Tax=Hyaloperonospora arabidopsidis (strain Emoy2) TaxID=559515 RepID=M4BLZ6_HYAAE